MEQNKFKRLWQHLLHPHLRVGRCFPSAGLQRISREIGESEAKHLGEIRFVIESRYSALDILNGLQPRTRALQWFGELGIWDTEHNSGVLIYISFADHAIEIVADRGISAKIEQAYWQNVCTVIQQHFLRQDYINGLQRGIREVDKALAEHFPRRGAADENELPDDVVLR